MTVLITAATAATAAAAAAAAVVFAADKGDNSGNSGNPFYRSIHYIHFSVCDDHMCGSCHLLLPDCLAACKECLAEGTGQCSVTVCASALWPSTRQGLEKGQLANVVAPPL